jgi:hypothetical protein
VPATHLSVKDRVRRIEVPSLCRCHLWLENTTHIQKGKKLQQDLQNIQEKLLLKGHTRHLTSLYQQIHFFFFHNCDFIVLRISTQTFQFVYNFSHMYQKSKAMYWFFLKLFQWHSSFKTGGKFSLRTSRTISSNADQLLLNFHRVTILCHIHHILKFSIFHSTITLGKLDYHNQMLQSTHNFDSNDQGVVFFRKQLY